MIYESNRKNQPLDKSLFQNPTAEYRATPFWAWNCDLQKDELLRQIDIFKEMGLGGFHMHCRAGMSTTYLSDEFMELVKACTDHAKENNMLAWLYDEDMWPSGFGGGYVTRDHSFRQRYLVFTCDPNYMSSTDALLIARFDVVLGKDKSLSSYRKVIDGDAVEGVLWSVWREIAEDNPRYNNQAYVDTLNKKAIERFIEVTHKRYFETVGDDFGKTVPAIFTDEPQFARKGTLAFADSKQNVTLPWTDDLEETFTAAYGESLVDHLPELLWDLPDGQISLTRYHYHDHISERFAQAFADTCGSWCNAHGIALTGHMMEEPTLHSQTSAIGDCMRSYRAFDIPGIDMLCAAFEFTTAKQCQSAVHQYGRPGMMSELYGVTGWDFDFRGHKLHGDWQAALGVTVRVPHLSWVSMKGTAKRDYPASISYQSPWYKEYNYVEDHFGRVNTALTRGKPLVKVAVIHPVESYWLHWGPNEQTQVVRDKMDDNFHNITSWLLTGNIDFDYICESTFSALCPTGGAPLCVGEMAYDVVIVPECETLRSTTLERLEAFRAAGGKLVFMGDAPKYEDAMPSTRGKALFDGSRQIAFSRGAILEELYEDRTVEIRERNGALTTNLLHQIRQDETGRWLFISHCTEPYNKDVSHNQHLRIYVKGICKPQLWDTITGEIRPLRYSHEGSRTLLHLRLFDYDSALIFLEDTEEVCSLEPHAPPHLTNMELPIPDTVSYTLTEPNVLLLDMARYALNDEPLSDAEEILRIDRRIREKLKFPNSKPQPWVVPNTPAEHTLTLEFTVHSEIEYPTPSVALEDADVATILWNGEPVTALPDGYYVDKAIQTLALPPLRKGENTLRVTIPFSQRSNCEAMYLLGEFGVRVTGRRLTVTPLPDTLGFSDLTYQGLPFYGGALSYHIPVTYDEDVDAVIQIPHYTAAVNTVEVDGERKAVVAYPPYYAELGKMSLGKHTVSVTTYVTRRNCFGDVHNADEKMRWLGPNSWVTDGSAWTYEYRLRRTGVLTTPKIYRKD
ncbi:MAG: hypothetical protein E7610_09105 [Ruminococcaceae bacterium]|nr:hypothetical protein [Oscillospiraceae bacterium]